MCGTVAEAEVPAIRRDVRIFSLRDKEDFRLFQELFKGVHINLMKLHCFIPSEEAAGCGPSSVVASQLGLNFQWLAGHLGGAVLALPSSRHGTAHQVAAAAVQDGEEQNLAAPSKW